jgi:zinc protease
MLFKGTAELKAGEFSRRVAALGGRENAFTMRDATGYFQQIPAGKLEDVMKLEADRFANNRWPDDEFKRELEVVKEERRLRTEDQPRSLMWETLNATVYQASPYRRPIVGWMSDLEAMTAQDARDFYRHWYVPGNATVVVAGDVDPQQVLRLAEKYYGRIPARPVPPRKPRDEPEQVGVRRIEFKAPAEQAYVALAFKVPQLTSFEPGPANDDALALTVLAAVLDGYSGARLERALTQGSDRVADSVGAGNGLWGRGPQLFTLDGVPAKGKTPEQVEAALRAEVAKVAREGVNEAELTRVKTQWIAAEVYKLDSVMNQARELGVFWVQGLPLDAGERLIQRLRGVTAEQVKSVAARYFGDDQLTIGTLRPQPVDPNRKPRTPPPGMRH